MYSYNRRARVNSCYRGTRQYSGEARLIQKSTQRVDNYDLNGYLVSKTITNECTYSYDTVMKRERHMAQMINKGYKVIGYGNNITVTYRRVMY